MSVGYKVYVQIGFSGLNHKVTHKFKVCLRLCSKLLITHRLCFSGPKRIVFLFPTSN